MRNFILFFQGKEGTSPFVRIMDNFEHITIIRKVDGGWEPFDKHNCGPMPLHDLEQCLKWIFDKRPIDMVRLNQIYTESAASPLESFDKNGTIGFKMRFVPPRVDLPILRDAPVPDKLVRSLRHMYIKYQKSRGKFKRLMFELLKKHEVLVLLAVRQDVLRWALSKYHGDGTGKMGHLQFKLARGELDRADISRIYVDKRPTRKTHCTISSTSRREARIQKRFGASSN